MAKVFIKRWGKKKLSSDQLDLWFENYCVNVDLKSVKKVINNMIVRPSAFFDIFMDKIYKVKTEIKPLQSLISIANMGESKFEWNSNFWRKLKIMSVSETKLTFLRK